MAFADNAPDAAPDKHTGLTYKGKEIVLVKTRGHPKQGLTQMGIEKGIYPEEKKVEAVTLYAATGNLEVVETLSKVPMKILKKWRKEDWFQDLIREIRIENNEQLDVKFTKIVETALDQLQDRIDNGDFQVTKTGDVVRRPVGARDLALVSAINVDKRQLLRGEPTSRSESLNTADGSLKKLEQLAATFAKLAGKEPKQIEIVDAEFTEVMEGVPELAQNG